ncbi:tyrosine-type recombinase/integrase [Ahrensia kielensis]|uniref:Tyrosine-type recombinase/integrase n=1 Tax=Ahrensia kielensis TaxID=76980 RepID=A0ABU9T6S4_9HYPH
MAHKIRDAGCTDPRDFISRAEIITVEDVLKADAARKAELASAVSERAAMNKIVKSSIGKKNIASLRKTDFAKLKKEWEAEGLANSSISKYLSSLRSAVNEAIADKALDPKQVIKIPEYRKQVNRDVEEQKGANVTPKEIAAIFDNLKHAHARLAYFWLLNTGARVGAVLDLKGNQIDYKNGLIDLNPKGRTQNNKFRPIQPLSTIAIKWSSMLELPKGPLIQYRGKQVRSMKNAMRGAIRKAGLSQQINTYSIRYAMAAHLRKHGIATEQIALFLGHSQPNRRYRITQGYAPFPEDYLKNLVPVIDEFILEIDSHSSRKLIVPDEWIANYIERLKDIEIV